jgi:uncharacterized membrane protein YidH (DUF202 family)
MTPGMPPNDPAPSPASSSPDASAGPADVDDIDERDPGLAAERTSLAWTRTAISFAALGGVVLKVSVIPGLLIVLMGPLVWWVGTLRRRSADRLWLITVSIVFVAVLSLLVAVISHGASHALRP